MNKAQKTIPVFPMKALSAINPEDLTEFTSRPEIFSAQLTFPFAGITNAVTIPIANMRKAFDSFDSNNTVLLWDVEFPLQEPFRDGYFIWVCGRWLWLKNPPMLLPERDSRVVEN